MRTRKAGSAHSWHNLEWDVFWETEGKGKKGVRRKERCTKREEHERVMKERLGKGEKRIAGETGQHLPAEGTEHFWSHPNNVLAGDQRAPRVLGQRELPRSQPPALLPVPSPRKRGLEWLLPAASHAARRTSSRPQTPLLPPSPPCRPLHACSARSQPPPPTSASPLSPSPSRRARDPEDKPQQPSPAMRRQQLTTVSSN